MNTKRTKEEKIQKKTCPSRGRFSGTIIAFLVVLVQLLLPIAPAFAEEGAPIPETVDAVLEPAVETETVTTEESPAGEAYLVTPPTVTADASPETATHQTEEKMAEEETLELSIENVVDESTIESDSENTSATSTEEALPIDSFKDPSEASTETPEEETLSEEEVPLPEEIIEEDGVIPELFDTETDTNDDSNEVTVASTTLEQTVVPPEIHTVTNDANRVSFGIDDCAQVADGSFYCRSKEEVVTPITTDRVFAGPDIDGDSEIYIERSGEVTQITENLVDDSAPYYDAESESIVWHRLVDARYQIVSYDLNSGEEIVLTNDHYNNMQPSRAGNITVWQGWVGSDWEILLMVDGEITMITDNTLHDIGPRINGDHVIWQADEADGWKVRVYDRLTKETETIAGADGASIENPRFVLLYDAKQENGDVETRGYDLESGENVPLGVLPRSIPDEIPDPDQTGEDRALIVNTTQLKTKTEDDSEPDTDTLDQTVPVTTGTTTEDVVIPPFGEGNLADDSASTSSPTTTTDLVIEPLVEEAPVVVIPDLVVLPYALPHVEEVDPQGEVATTS